MDLNYTSLSHHFWHVSGWTVTTCGHSLDSSQKCRLGFVGIKIVKNWKRTTDQQMIFFCHWSKKRQWRKCCIVSMHPFMQSLISTTHTHILLTHLFISSSLWQGCGCWARKQRLVQALVADKRWKVCSMFFWVNVNYNHTYPSHLHKQILFAFTLV